MLLATFIRTIAKLLSFITFSLLFYYFFITLKYSKLLFRLSRVLKLYKVDQSKITNRFKIIFINKKNTKFKFIMYINR